MTPPIPAGALLAGGVHKPLPERIPSPPHVHRPGAWEPEILRAERLARETDPAPAAAWPEPEPGLEGALEEPTALELDAAARILTQRAVERANDAETRFELLRDALEALLREPTLTGDEWRAGVRIALGGVR